MLAACARRNARQDEEPRSGAGRIPASSSTLRTEVAETAIPTPLSSPTIRRYPQCGFSWASRKMSVRSDDSTGGRPGFLCGYVQRRATSWRCQRSSVCGLTGKPAQAGRGSERLSAASNARSARVSVGRAACRRKTANSCRRMRISNSFERRGRASNHTSANRFRTTRYTNDQSKQPSLDHDKSGEPNGPDAPTSRGRVCEPTRLVVLGGAFESIDPALQNSSNSFTALGVAYDGLTAFRRVGGSEGTQPVPNLAAALPQPTDAGRSYTFRMRPGIRYSDG